MNDPDRPPRLLFVHEWWLQLRDDLNLAGALFNCSLSHDPQMPSEIEFTMFDLAETALLTAIARGALPQTTHQIIYGIWFEPENDWQPMLGPVLNDYWLTPLRDGVGTPDRVGSVQIISVQRSDDDRKSDPRLEEFPDHC